MRRSIKEMVAGGCVLLLAAMNCSGLPEVKIDVSQIIDKPTAESILGVKVQYPTPRNIQGNEGYYSKCNYYSLTPGKTLLLRLYQAAEGRDPEQQLNVVMKNTPGLKPVSGLGDKAFVTNGAASAMPPAALMLYVMKARSILTIGLSGYQSDTAALENAKAVAQKILSQL